MNGAEPHRKQDSCPHSSIQKKRGQYEFNAYVCGSCGSLFDVKRYEEPKPVKEPMFPKNPVPWGLRPRQA